MMQGRKLERYFRDENIIRNIRTSREMKNKSYDTYFKFESTEVGYPTSNIVNVTEVNYQYNKDNTARSYHKRNMIKANGILSVINEITGIEMLSYEEAITFAKYDKYDYTTNKKSDSCIDIFHEGDDFIVTLEREAFEGHKIYRYYNIYPDGSSSLSITFEKLSDKAICIRIGDDEEYTLISINDKSFNMIEVNNDNIFSNEYNGTLDKNYIDDIMNKFRELNWDLYYLYEYIYSLIEDKCDNPTCIGACLDNGIYLDIKNCILIHKDTRYDDGIYTTEYSLTQDEVDYILDYEEEDDDDDYEEQDEESSNDIVTTMMNLDLE